MLLKQDKTEALMSVNGRLEFIEKEIRRFETQIKGIQDKSEKVKVEVRHSRQYRTACSNILTTRTDHADTKCRAAAAAAAAASTSTSISIKPVFCMHRPEAE